MSFITVAGEQLIAQKQGANQPMIITEFVLAYIDGLGAEPSNRIEAMPDVGDIVYSHALTRQGYINANQVVYSLVMDSTVGTFTFNWVGLKAQGGELVAVAYQDPQIKSASSGGVPGNNLTKNFLLAFSGAQATTAIDVPAETWQIDFTTRLLQVDDRERLSNFDIYGQSAFFGDYFKVAFVSGNTYKITNGFGYVGGIRVYIPDDLNITATGLPKSVWVDASLQGNINGLEYAVAFTVTSSTLVDYVDSLGYKHYVAKLADIVSAGSVIDTRPIAPPYVLRSDVVPQAEAEAGAATTPRTWTAQRVKQAFSAFLTLGFEAVAAKTGYIKLPTLLGGFILQWGRTAVSGDPSSGTVTFPKAYTTECYFCIAKNTDPSTTSPAAELVEVTVYDEPTLTGFKWFGTDIKNGVLTGPGAFSWFSIGK